MQNKVLEENRKLSKEIDWLKQKKMVIDNEISTTSLEKNKRKSLNKFNFRESVPFFNKKFEDAKNQTSKDNSERFKGSINLKQIANEINIGFLSPPPRNLCPADNTKGKPPEAGIS